ncbi:MAG: zinc ribbon domain-containing protein [Propionivibrio sp.]
MFCKKCGHTLNELAKFCGKCGEAVPTSAPVAPPAPADAAHCPQCGCQVRIDAKFCKSCGSPIAAQPPELAAAGAVGGAPSAKLTAVELPRPDGALSTGAATPVPVGTAAQSVPIPTTEASTEIRAATPATKTEPAAVETTNLPATELAAPGATPRMATPDNGARPNTGRLVLIGLAVILVIAAVSAGVWWWISGQTGAATASPTAAPAAIPQAQVPVPTATPAPVTAPMPVPVALPVQTPIAPPVQAPVAEPASAAQAPAAATPAPDPRSAKVADQNKKPTAAKKPGTSTSAATSQARERDKAVIKQTNKTLDELLQ